MRPVLLALAALLALAGCASPSLNGETAPAAQAPTSVAACAPSGRPDDVCALPADVRAYIEDREACDHFRAEPWPESDGAADRARRQAILDGIRTSCAGSDGRLAELKARYASDPVVSKLLAALDPIDH